MKSSFLPQVFAPLKNYFSIILSLLGSFPSDDEPVSDALIKACAAVDESKWEALAIALDISLNQGLLA